MSRDWPKEVAGSGVWVARDGLERRRTLRERECALVDWMLDWAMVDLMILSLVDGWTSSSLLAYRDSLLSKDTLRSNDGRVYDLVDLPASSCIRSVYASLSAIFQLPVLLFNGPV